MKLRHAILALTVFSVTLAVAAPQYRSFIEWNGPYYHVLNGYGADSSVYSNYMVNNPLPLYSQPFSSPTAVALCGSPLAQTAFVVDHDHRRVQVFSTNADVAMERLTYSGAPQPGSFNGHGIELSRGMILPGSDRVLINHGFFSRVSNLAAYSSTDSVYTIAYDGLAGTGGVITLPSGWTLGPFDSVRVEYAFDNPPVSPGTGDLDYVLFQATPSDIPLQLNETTSPTDPDMSDLTSLAVNASVRSGAALDLYLVNALPGGEGTLSSYDLSSIGEGGIFHHVDTYPGVLGRPYGVKIVDNGSNVPGTIAQSTASGVSNARLTQSIINQNTFLGHNYRIALSFDTTTAMNPSAAPDNLESDLAFEPASGRLHMVFCRDDGPHGTSYSYSDDYGQTWSSPLTISPPTLTAAHDRPRIALRQSGEMDVVYEAINALGERHLYFTSSPDGRQWSETANLTFDITPSVVHENRYANLIVDPATDNVHLIWSGDDDVYECVLSSSWSSCTLIAEGSGSGFSAPHAVADESGRIYLAFVTNAVPPCAIGYMVFDGAEWGSTQGGSFAAGVVDTVATMSGVASADLGRGELFPFPQVALTGDSVWVFWAGQGWENYGSDPIQIYYARIASRSGDFVTTGGAAIGTQDVCAPLRFCVVADADHNLHIAYPFGSTVNQEGLRCKTWTQSSRAWLPGVLNPGRIIFQPGQSPQTFVYEPRLIVPAIAGQSVPMLSCGKAYANVDGGSPRILFKILDGVLIVTDRTALSQFNRFRVWTEGAADSALIPGLSLTITNSSDAVSNTDDNNANEFNLGDYFDLAATPPLRKDLLFLSDADSNRVKIIRAGDNISHCFAGDERWDVPGKSDGSPSQTYKLAATGGEGTYRVWASPDTVAWTIVRDLLIAGPGDHVCEVNRYTHELRFGDNIHGAIPPAGAFIRVRYDESVDEAEFGGPLWNHPHGLAARYNSNLGHYDVYVCDSGNNRIEKWSYRPDPTMDPASWSNPVVAWHAASSATDVLADPEDVEVAAVDDQIFVVVSDNGNHRLVIYRDNEASGSGGSTAPVFVSSVGDSGASLNSFPDPRGLALMSEDSGLVIMAADAARNEVAKIVSRSWIAQGTPDTTSGSTGSHALTLSFSDPLDGDANLLFQPGAERTVELRLSHCDSLMGLRAVAAFPVNMLSVIGVSEGNLWSGERYTNKVFLYTIDSVAGQIEINASMVGDNDGLSTSGSRVVATLLVRALPNLTVPDSGSISLTDSTDLRRVGNIRVNSYTRSPLKLLGGYLGDIAADGGNPGTPPHMIPQPDGKIDFGDVNAFTLAWNGNGLIFDRLGDIGPFIGDSLPKLIAAPDGCMDAHDLLALSTMYNWYGAATAITLPPQAHSIPALDEPSPVILSATRDNGHWRIEIRAQNVQALMTAHIQLQVGGGTISALQPSDFLGSDHELFLHHEQGGAADISMGRLNRENPCVSGSGVLAVANVAVTGEGAPQVRVIYELRDNHDSMIASGETATLSVVAAPQYFSFASPYPNPFNSVTTFTLNLSAAGHASLRVYNLLGQQTAEILNGDLTAGEHRIAWNAASLPSGIYLVRLETSSHSAVQKIVLLR
jgi:hypothetical protein